MSLPPPLAARFFYEHKKKITSEEEEYIFYHERVKRAAFHGHGTSAHRQHGRTTTDIKQRVRETRLLCDDDYAKLIRTRVVAHDV